MAFDLSAVDAELEQLGRAPEDPLHLARDFAGSIGSLASVDDELSALAQLSGVSEPLYVTRPLSAGPPEGALGQHAPAIAQPVLLPLGAKSSIPPRRRISIPLPPAEKPAAAPADGMPPESEPARQDVPLTRSQEIVLPDPIPREELSTESGELSLDAAAPNSGSYSLPDAQPERDEASSFTRAGHDFDDMVDDEIQDALDGSRPLSIGGPSVGHATRSMDRDPDAEFDALLSEATDPRGIPMVDGSELDADDLLGGLDVDDLDMVETPITQESEADQATHEADELARSLYEEAEPDNTEILDRASALAIEAQAPGAARGALATEGDAFREELSADAELDSDELELMLDDEPAPPPPPSVPKAPAPPPGAGEKRPSILGRFFGGKRDGE